MNNYDEIKSLLKASRNALGGKLNESQNRDILRKYNLLTEQPVEEVIDQEVEEKKESEPMKKDSDDIGKARDKQKGYKIQGNVLILHGDKEADIEKVISNSDRIVSIHSEDEEILKLRNHIIGNQNLYLKTYTTMRKLKKRFV